MRRQTFIAESRQCHVWRLVVFGVLDSMAVLLPRVVGHELGPGGRPDVEPVDLVVLEV
jgi:hypothetical protein